MPDETDMMGRCVQAATALVTQGRGFEVREALAEIGAARVTEVPEAGLPGFLALLRRMPTSVGRYVVGGEVYKIEPTSCACGGQWAWLRLRDSGAWEMVGCVCHTLPGGHRVRVEVEWGVKYGEDDEVRRCDEARARQRVSPAHGDAVVCRERLSMNAHTEWREAT